jgi:hypothetical protein
MNIQEQFKIEFENAFRWLKLATERGKDLQVDLVMTNEALAGPLYSILTDGNCNYVFKDSEKRFPGVTTVEDFRAWSFQLAEKYRKGVEAFQTSNSAEAADREQLLEKAIAMHRVAELAYQIQKEQASQ